MEMEKNILMMEVYNLKDIFLKEKYGMEKDLIKKVK